MSVISPEASAPLDEPQMASRRQRIAHLALMVFELMKERYQGGTSHEFDQVEEADLLTALRACSWHTDEIGCFNFDELFVIQIKGIDGHDYMIQFSLLGPPFSVHAARVRIAKLSLSDREGGEHSTHNTMNVIPEYSKRLKLNGVTTERTFLVGMALVIGLMDDQGDDPDEAARLAPLSNLLMPNEEEFREIRAKVAPPSLDYGDDEELPY